MSAAQDPKHLLSSEQAVNAEAKAIAQLLRRLPEARDGTRSSSVLEASFRGVQRRRRATTRRHIALATAGCSMAVLLATVGLRHSPSGVAPDQVVAQSARASLETTLGTVSRPAPGAPWLPAEAGAQLAPGAQLRTDATGHALLGLTRAQALVAAGTELSFSALGETTVLSLSAGKVTAEVNPRSAGQSFAIQTEHYRVTVKGTLFAVQAHSAEDVTVSCTHGLVEVSAGATRWLVPGGHAWHSLAPDRQTTDDIPQADRDILEPPESSQSIAQRAVVASGEAHAPAMAPGPEAAEAALERRSAPTPLAVPSPTRAGASAKPSNLLTSHGVTRVTGAHPGSLNPSAPATAPAIDPYFAALALERTGDYQGAARALEALAARRSAQADLALYHLAELEQRRLGEPARALTHYQRYTQDYADRPLVQEAELSILELDLQLAALPQALSQMNRFLARHPDSERVPELHVLRGNVLREQGHYSEALADYRAAHGSRVDDDASYYGALCQRALGATAEAEASVESYLRRFPAGKHSEEARALATSLRQ